MAWRTIIALEVGADAKRERGRWNFCRTLMSAILFYCCDPPYQMSWSATDVLRRSGLFWDVLRSSHAFNRFLKNLQHSWFLWGVLRILEVFWCILMVSGRLWTVSKCSDASFDVFGKSEAFLNDFIGFERILNLADCSEALSIVLENSEVFRVVQGGSERSLIILKHSLMFRSVLIVLRHSCKIWSVLKGSWRFWGVLWCSEMFWAF